MAETLITVMVEGNPKQHGFAPSSTGSIPVSQLENRFPGAYTLTYDREGMEVMISETLGYLQAPKGGWSEEVIYMVAIRQVATQSVSSRDMRSSGQKVERPILKCTEGCVNPDEWTNFVIEWKEYKILACLDPKKQHPIELTHCIDQTQRHKLRTKLPEVGTYTEREVLKAMNDLFVTYNNRFVMKEALRKMTQGHDEPIQQFAARCKTAGAECYFKVKCDGCDTLVDYTHLMCRDQLVLNLAKTETSNRIYREDNPDKDEISLDDIVRSVAVEEAVTRSNQVFQPDGVQSMKQSSYQKAKKEKFVSKPDDKCTFCSREGHTEDVCRQKLTCTYCKKTGHLAGGNCWKKKGDDNKKKGEKKHEISDIPEQEEQVQYYYTMKQSGMSHVQYDDVKEAYGPKRSSPMPTMEVIVSVDRSAFYQFRLRTDKLSSSKPTTIFATMDTGASVCVMDEVILEHWGSPRKPYCLSASSSPGPGTITSSYWAEFFWIL